MSQRQRFLLALAVAAMTGGGVAAACPSADSVDPRDGYGDEDEPPTYVAPVVQPRVRELPSPPLVERFGLFAVVPFLTGYGATTILCRRCRRRRRQNEV